MTTPDGYNRFARLSLDAIENLRRELETTQSPLIDLLESIPSPAAILTQERQVVISNRKLVEISGGPANKLLGARPGEILHCRHAETLPEGCGTGEVCLTCEIFNSIISAINAHISVESESHFLSIVGEKTLAVSAGPCPVVGRTLLNVVFQDVTALRTLEKEHETSQRLEGLATLISGIGHEINNPLAIAMGNSYLLQHEFLAKDLLTPRMLSLFARVDDALRRIADLVKQFSRFQNCDVTGFTSLKPDAILTPLIEGFQNDSHPHIIWETDFAEVSPIAVVAPWMVRVLENIFANAFDALKDSPSPHIRVRLFQAENSVAIEVIDNGLGMNESVVAQAFQPLFSTKFDAERPGLGLFEAQKLMNAMKGSISLHSQPDEGTRVTLLFPAATLSTLSTAANDSNKTS